jgi:hypothetical protein
MNDPVPATRIDPPVSPPIGHYARLCTPTYHAEPHVDLEQSLIIIEVDKSVILHILTRSSPPALIRLHIYMHRGSVLCYLCLSAATIFLRTCHVLSRPTLMPLRAANRSCAAGVPWQPLSCFELKFGAEVEQLLAGLCLSSFRAAHRHVIRYCISAGRSRKVDIRSWRSRQSSPLIDLVSYTVVPGVLESISNRLI